MQLDVASRYCENIITFSYSHYYSPNLVKSMYIETYRDYVSNGYVLETQNPTDPANATAVSGENGITISWEASDDNFGIAYYRICKNGEFFTRVENYKWDYPLTVTDSEGTSDDVYTIVAVDAAGNRSGEKTFIY